MENRYVQLSNEEALNAKKQLLSSEISLLQTYKKVNTYRFLRTKEIALQNKLKLSIGSIKASLSLMQSTFPEHLRKEREKEKIPKTKSEVKQERNFQNELNDIKVKLARLG